ncbi:ATP-binding cassette permease mdl2 [Monosporozyma unispora]|nr:ATP-binding cassette permease mdl2 [Kazachstania unispora]
MSIIRLPLLLGRTPLKSLNKPILFKSNIIRFNSSHTYSQTLPGPTTLRLKPISYPFLSSHINILSQLNGKRTFHSYHPIFNNSNTTTTNNNTQTKIAPTQLDNESKDLWRLLKLIKNDWKMLSIALTLLTFSCSIGMTIPKIIGVVLDSLRSIESPQNLHDLVIWNGIQAPMFFGITLAALCVGCFANYIRVILLRLLSERLVIRLRSKLMKHILHMDAKFFDKYKVGDLMSRINNDAFLVSRSITQRVSDGVKALIVGTAGVGMMFSLSWELSSVLMLMMGPPLFISAKIMGKQIRWNSKKLQESTANLTKLTEEQFNGIKTIQSFVAENNELHKFNHSIRDIFHIGKKFAFINAKFFTTASLISDFSFLIVLTYGSYLVLHGGITAGDLTAFMLYTEYTGNAIFNMSNFYSELMQGAGAATRLFELTDSIPHVHSTRGVKLLPLRRQLTSSEKVPATMNAGSVEFQNVTFAYPTRPTLPIFKNMSFKIQPGSNYCIVGPSGKGKSTIAWLLIRCYDVQSGHILINGQDIKDISAKSLRRQVAIVQQEPVLMSGTIRDNITYGLTYTPTKEQIRSVAKQCFCHNFITKLPNTYDTMIGPQGTLLSGGQKQRIAIARALIKKPKILILDEATSALDVESEGAINYTFGKLMKSKSMTIISIAHRLSTIRRSENIIVLGNDGNVIEIGKFKELYADPASELSKLLSEKSLPGSTSTSHEHMIEENELPTEVTQSTHDTIQPDTNAKSPVYKNENTESNDTNASNSTQESSTITAEPIPQATTSEEIEEDVIKDLLKDVTGEKPLKLTNNEQ